MTKLTSDACFRLVGKLSTNMAPAFAIAAALAAVITGGTESAAATLDQAPYGSTQGGLAVDIFTMTNDHGLRVRFLNLGGVITEIDAHDRTGRPDNIVLGLCHGHFYRARIESQGSPRVMPLRRHLATVRSLRLGRAAVWIGR